ncbi:MAG: endonuclease/exonuclease/phosphatase family protein [Planctomycetes bacterium]|nr:endonuclease/exonuclease/phosphatase family protein [Planctomycetota bacterium]
MRVRWTNLILLLALPAAPAALAPWLSSWHWSVDLAASFAVQVSGWLLACALVLAAARRWRPAVALATAAAIAALAVVPTWWPGTRRLGGEFITYVDKPGQLTACALNLLFEKDQEPDRAVEWLRRTNPDLVFCGEFTTGWKTGLEPAVTALPHRCLEPQAGAFGVGLYSRWPLSQVTVEALGPARTPAIRAVVATPSGPIGVLGIHPTPPYFSAGHIADRDGALADVARLLEGLPPRRIVLGDCNAAPWNRAFAAMLRDTGLQPGTAAEWLPTWPSTLPWPLRLPLDHVLVGGDLEMLDCAVGHDFGSDHLPIVARIRPVPR